LRLASPILKRTPRHASPKMHYGDL
jgi:hypothetical protein